MCLHLKVCQYDFNIKIYLFVIKIAVILNSHSFLIDWANELVMFWTRFFFPINTGCIDITNSTFSTI